MVGAADITADLTYTTPATSVRVAGRIVAESGNPRLGNARIMMSNPGTPITPAADGTFKTALTEGRYQVWLSSLPVGYLVKSITSGSANLLNDTLSIDGKKGPEVSEVIVTLAPMPRFKVHGHVVADPPTRPVAGAEVLLTGFFESFRTTVAADGTFEFPAVLPATYALAIRPFGFTYVNATVVVADQDQSLEFTSQPAY